MSEHDCCDLTNCGPGPDKRGPTDKVDDPFMQRMVDQIADRVGSKNDIHSGMPSNDKKSCPPGMC